MSCSDLSAVAISWMRWPGADVDPSGDALAVSVQALPAVVLFLLWLSTVLFQPVPIPGLSIGRTAVRYAVALVQLASFASAVALVLEAFARMQACAAVPDSIVSFAYPSAIGLGIVGVLHALVVFGPPSRVGRLVAPFDVALCVAIVVADVLLRQTCTSCAAPLFPAQAFVASAALAWLATFRPNASGPTEVKRVTFSKKDECDVRVPPFIA